MGCSLAGRQRFRRVVVFDVAAHLVGDQIVLRGRFQKILARFGQPGVPIVLRQNDRHAVVDRGQQLVQPGHDDGATLNVQIGVALPIKD